MKRAIHLSVLILVGLVACTRDPGTQVVQVPTLAVLATQVVSSGVTQFSTEPPSPIRPPTITPTLTLSPLPSVTALPSTTDVPPTATQGAQDLSGWVILTQVSPFDDNVTYGLVRIANAPVQTWLSSVTPTMFFRCKGGAFDIFIQIGAELENPPDLTDQVHVKLRYDQEPTIDAVMQTSGSSPSAEDSATFIDAQTTLSAMLTHKTLAFGFTPYNSAFAYTTFTLDGLAVALQPLAAACNLKIA